MRAIGIGLMVIVGALFAASPASADRWKFVGDGEVKFGYEPRGRSNFEPIWFRCEDGRISASAAIGERRPSGGRGSASLSAGGRNATIAGEVSEFDFDGVFSVDTTIDRDHPALTLLAQGGPVAYQAAGWKRQTLAAAGLKPALDRFLSACR